MIKEIREAIYGALLMAFVFVGMPSLFLFCWLHWQH
jgi:hypothetical protein